MNNTHLNDPQTVALTRFKAVNTIEEHVRNGTSLAQALREASVCPWPDEYGRCYAVRTLEDWWYGYLNGGFAALEPQKRSDSGTCRVIDADTGRWLIEQVCQYPKIPVKVLYEHWKQEGKELPPLRSLYRYLKRHGYDRKTLAAGRLESGPTKAFATPHVNELWMVDFSPGPKLRTEAGSVQSTQLCILVDDCSRLIPFAGYYPKADTKAFLNTLKEAVLRRGLPRKLYTDQGKPFVCHHAHVVCATLGIRLLHAKPYHAWSKGKCERLIQTIQNGFESTLRIEGNQAKSLDALNEKLSQWIQATYHQRVHSATQCTPEARYHRELAHIRKLEIDASGVDCLFYTRKERTVRKDGTVRIDKKLYEVDLSLRALRVELRFDPFTLTRIEVYHRDAFVCLAKPVNLRLNSETGGSQSYAERG
ncbi:MAG: DDE-type integrase/transposase/recombinase [Verrucomicrobia bacterium]|jgi:putative transposase|nr:DDE-type integrase/transposase/recombinase [Verrucomicrobiota bacterium]MBT7066684.1 DDE-type integrase/transposase/recombinase [Verrucomicrobiota bacterium]MBT7702206.1 DDE-type integrase/transposase/recombinase [Verrucomicrobiota bacterium]